MPIHLPQCAGQPYRQSNGSEGDRFIQLFCERCTKCNEYGTGCDITDATMIYETSHENYPAEWIFDSEGNPTCTAFEKA